MLTFENVISAEELGYICQELDSSDFVAGDATTENARQGLKRNLQLGANEKRQELGNMVLGAIRRHVGIRRAILPYKFSFPMFSRYDVGMYYGVHTDAALLNTGDPAPLRTDVFCTLFLSDPESYDGGHLTLVGEGASIQAKLPAGDVAIYPTGELHHVAEVTRGARLAAVLWIQSQIRDDGQRRILAKLGRLCEGLERDDVAPESVNLASSAANSLLRMWGEV